MKYPKWLGLALATAWVGIIGLLTFPIASDEVRTENATTLYDQNDQVLARYSTNDSYWRLPPTLEEIDPNFIRALLAIEDARFYSHSGVDIPAIGRALKTWHSSGQAKSGASTITMQLVRQYKPRPRVLKSKAIESLAALKYELVFSKDDILEQYLTRISYGSNIQGIEAASWRYFKKTPRQLTWDEIALLIALPQAPEARRPDRHPVAAKAGRDRILSKLVDEGVLTEQLAREAKDVPVPQFINDFPSDAEIGAPLLSARDRDVHSFIDPQIQQSAHRVLAQSLGQQDRAVNASILVVENKTRNVVAQVTAGARDHEGGWLDLTRAIRSPGSTLKPFIYGLAMSDGQAAMNSTIRDAPTRFGAYQPENFNRRYHGKVRLQDALKHSLNVPAVAALDQVGSARFEALLTSAGAIPRFPKHRDEDSGLSLALGGAGMTAVDLATLYTALANDGVAKPLNWEFEQSREEVGVQILPPDMVQKITEVLTSATPPQGRLPGHLSQSRSAIAYKTGTSYGARDSWAAGYAKDHTIVVWVGRPDGAPRPGETGRESAAPLLFDVFDSLTDRSERPLRIVDNRIRESKAFKTSLDAGPQISFPSDGSEVLIRNSRKDLRLRAQSSKDLRFYVDGEILDAKYGAATFKPKSAGFYTLKVVDSDGRSSLSRFRILLADNLAHAPL
ncbi:penicillin-binding protein 1C [Litorimonas haliclonae]|uniref:penicillin-binding protein 1C n=1 Tax=Litorimonas haliclonae TaxID=2081977 RepID=UPI0039F0FF93